MKKLALLLTLALFGISGCAQEPVNRPSDFKLVLSWHTGAVPENYWYSYRLIIGPSTTGKLQYRSGNGQVEWSDEFTVPDEDLDTLYTHTREQGLLRSKWEQGDQIDGGPATSIEITSNGNFHSIGERSELIENERKLVDALIDRVENLVPDDLWETMYQLQAEQEMKVD
jgi:hypothetical protein